MAARGRGTARLLQANKREARAVRAAGMKGESRAVVLRILSYLKPFKKAFLLVGLLLAGSTVIGFLQPLVIQTITDDGMLQKNMPVLVRAVLALAALVLLNQAGEMLQTRVFAEVHNASFYALFQQAFQKLLHLKKSYFEDKNNAEILSFLQMDVSQVSSITDRYTIMSVGYVFRIISGLIGLFIISWKLALIVLAMVPVKFLLVRTLSKRREKAMEEMLESSRDFSRWFGDNLNGVDEIKLWNLFESRDKAFREKQQKVLRLQKRDTMIDAWNTLWESLLEWGVTLLLYLIGGIMICSGSLTIGAVFAFASYSGYVTGPVSALMNLRCTLRTFCLRQSGCSASSIWRSKRMRGRNCSAAERRGSRSSTSGSAMRRTERSCGTSASTWSRAKKLRSSGRTAAENRRF